MHGNTQNEFDEFKIQHLRIHIFIHSVSVNLQISVEGRVAIDLAHI